MSKNELEILRTTAYNCILDLATPDGIHASGKNEAFGCVFGRDSFITILKLLRSLQAKQDKTLLDICRRSLLTHVALQGKEYNIESGEQPGKFIHEYRVDRYERLINRPRPWYVYPDKKLRNYDSLDATPLGLIAIYRYWQQTQDGQFLLTVLPAVEKALNWIISYGDKDKDFLLEYELPTERVHGGLVVQSWADSAASLADIHGVLPPYPIAPVEVQGIAWLALRLWGNFYTQTYALTQNARFGQKLLSHATHLKEQFNTYFLLKSKGKTYFAQALDGNKRKIATITAHPLLCLWAADEQNGNWESIIQEEYIAAMVDRAFARDMFVAHAGIRTMSAESPTFDASEKAYHTGSFWPMLNGLIIEGLQHFGFTKQAEQLLHAMILPLHFFGSPIEVYIERDGSYIPYKSMWGQQSCMNQAWSAAAVYDVLTLHMAA